MSDIEKISSPYIFVLVCSLSHDDAGENKEFSVSLVETHDIYSKFFYKSTKLCTVQRVISLYFKVCNLLHFYDCRKVQTIIYFLDKKLELFIST